MQMHTTLYSPHSARQLFDLVVDVERYPEFLPWCRAARVLQRGDEAMLAELIIGFKGITESYVSRVVMMPPEGDVPGRVEVVMVRGPFEYLTNQWLFMPVQEAGGGCEINFTLDFKFRSKLLDKLIGSVFARAQEKMIGAFVERADALYGTAR